MSTTKTPRPGKVQICQAKDGQYYFRVKAGNGEILCTGEMHPQKAKAIHSARVMMDTAMLKEIEDLTL